MPGYWVRMRGSTVVPQFIKCKKRYRFKKATLYEREVIKKQKFFIRRQKLPYTHTTCGKEIVV
jgi:hypothetical protein